MWRMWRKTAAKRPARVLDLQAHKLGRVPKTTASLDPSAMAGLGLARSGKSCDASQCSGRQLRWSQKLLWPSGRSSWPGRLGFGATEVLELGTGAG